MMSDVRRGRVLQFDDSLSLWAASEAEQSGLRRLWQRGGGGWLPEEDRLLQDDLRPAGRQQGQVTRLRHPNTMTPTDHTQFHHSFSVFMIFVDKDLKHHVSKAAVEHEGNVFTVHPMNLNVYIDCPIKNTSS